MGFKRVSRSAPVTELTAAKPAAPQQAPPQGLVVEEVLASAPAIAPEKPAPPPPKRMRSASERYDPAIPNSYDDLVRERELRREQVRQEERLRRERAEWEKKEADRVEKIKAAKGQSIGMTADEAVRRRMEMSKAMGSRTAQELEASVQAEQDAARKIANETERKMSFAERMLRKQGWDDGKGLGRKQDGVATPLSVVRTSQTHAIIKQAEPVKQAAPQRKKGNTKIQGKPSKVVLLRNLVRPGTVDQELRGEVSSECAKYGEVKAVQIYEEADPQIPAEERVRIFVKFERIPEAMKAVVELDGRLFDGHTVSASFYDEAKFDLSTLTMQPDDPPLPPECRPSK
eukprot:TRINITY_DN10511_c0_g1_i1.p1 TRINITY_DN10511_c0_g1~~TRINITY_DN10511_c0_g1_i1.p1  ORF type:complete len:344 (+),score=142.74 TRINITY_DN10511_c0_g1_i1:438-1469(+)